MGTQEVELECAGEKSAVDGSEPVCSFIHNIIHHNIINHIIRPKSFGRVTHDSHKLQTEVIHHSTRHYMNRTELQSDQPIHVPLLRILSFPPSDVHCRHSWAGCATPSNQTTCKDAPAATVLSCAATQIHLYRQNRVRSCSSGDPQRRLSRLYTVWPIRVHTL